MLKIVNIEKCFSMFSDTFSPKIVAELNGQHIKVVRAEGDKVPWHIHDNEDEIFLVLDGTLEVHFNIAHTGKVRSEITKDQFDRLDL